MTDDVAERRATDSFSLAILRTSLANHRTLLAYYRTAITLSMAGVGLLHFNAVHSTFGYVTITSPVAALLAVIIGSSSYLISRREIALEARDGKADLPS
ncbi:DUF202 domain-containing protein [Hyphobacterium sp.]|uniref:DUF202 domain-containing protein n=1 Tax=Hyphobacterium sp. TaxID=2004662 RepID=UPI003B516D0D